MLKRIYIMFFVAVTSSFATLTSSVAVKNDNESLKSSRTFLGRIEIAGFWQSLRSAYRYRLYDPHDKDKCIACLDFNEKVRSPEILKVLVGKNVIVKGSSKFINKEPYLVVTVDDITADDATKGNHARE